MPHSHAVDHGHGGEHAKHPFLAHHFETPAQQFDSSKLGMWLFLATEVLFFGGLFVAYAVLRNRFPEVFSYASHYLSTTMGGINTCVLIVSSLTMASAVYFAQRSRKRAMLVCLWLTMAGAAAFMVIKYFEYTHKIHEHLVWGSTFYVPPDHEIAVIEGSHEIAAPAAVAQGGASSHATAATSHAASTSTDSVGEVLAPAAMLAAGGSPSFVGAPLTELSAVKPASRGPLGVALSGSTDAAPHGSETIAEGHPSAHLEDATMPANVHLFFAVYYAMTGLHGVHVLVGMVVIGMLIYRGMRGDFNSNFYTPVDLVGLYWHIVDLIWIFLFPLFYLIH